MPALLYTQGTLVIMAVGAVVVAWPVQAHEWSREVEILAGLKATDLVVTDPQYLKGDVVPVEVKEKPAAK